MKTLSLVLASISLAFLTSMSPAEPATPREEKGITFEDGTWKEVLAKAEAEGKLVFLDAYASWCGPCKMLKAHTFTDQLVGAYFNANFINAKMDMEKGEGPQLARQYGVTAYPTLFFVKSDGTVVNKAVGFRNAEQLLALGKEVAGK